MNEEMLAFNESPEKFYETLINFVQILNVELTPPDYPPLTFSAAELETLYKFSKDKSFLDFLLSIYESQSGVPFGGNFFNRNKDIFVAYWMRESNNHTLESLAAIYKVSGQRIYQIYIKALVGIRRGLLRKSNRPVQNKEMVEEDPSVRIFRSVVETAFLRMKIDIESQDLSPLVDELIKRIGLDVSEERIREELFTLIAEYFKNSSDSKNNLYYNRYLSKNEDLRLHIANNIFEAIPRNIISTYYKFLEYLDNNIDNILNELRSR